MKKGTSPRFRYWLISFVAGNPSAIKSFMLRSSILLCLTAMAAPIRVSREIVYGSGAEKPDLKTSLRSMLWLWTRSWIPIRHPLVTYFDIGWILSETSCEALRNRGFLSRDTLKRQCDLAQYTLSSVRAGIEADDHDKVRRADSEIQSLVGGVFDSAAEWTNTAAERPSKDETVASTNRPEPGTEQGGFDNSSTKAALLAFDDLCASIGQEYFLVSGTFLGVIRDRAFIGHDHDIDVGVFEDRLLDSLIPALQDSPEFIITKVDRICMRRNQGDIVRYSMMDKPAVIKMVHRSGIVLDVFIHFYDGKIAWHGTSLHRWDNQGFTLQDYKFLGRNFKGATDYDLYLTENYGPDWRVPKVDFDSSVDTPNISFVGSANGLVFWAWMVAQAVAEQDMTRVRKYLKLLTRLGVCPANDPSQPTLSDDH